MLASSGHEVLSSEQSLASAGITDGAVRPGVYEGSGEARGHKMPMETTIRIELAADGTFVYTETLSFRAPRRDKGGYVLTAAGVDFTPEGSGYKPFSIPVVEGAFQCKIGWGSGASNLSLKRVE